MVVKFNSSSFHGPLWLQTFAFRNNGQGFGPPGQSNIKITGVVIVGIENDRMVELQTLYEKRRANGTSRQKSP